MEKKVSSTNVAKKTEYLYNTCRRLKPDPYLTPCTKMNSKWTKDIYVKPGILTVRGNKLQKRGIGKDFLNSALVIWKIIPTINKGDSMKLKKPSVQPRKQLDK